MERTQKGGLKKYGDYVEVTFSGDEDYEACISKVIDALSWEYNSDYGSPFLCRLNGSRIIDKPITDGEGASVPWTVSRYIQSVFVSTSHVKLGVALFEVSCNLSA